MPPNTCCSVPAGAGGPPSAASYRHRRPLLTALREATVELPMVFLANPSMALAAASNKASAASHCKLVDCPACSTKQVLCG